MEEKKGWNGQLARIWTKMVGPSRPTISELAVYTKWAKIIQNNTSKRLKLLVLGSTPEFRDWGYENNFEITVMDGLNGSFYFNNDELKKISKLVKNRIAFYSDNDPFIPQEKLCEYVSLISAEEVVIENGGHLNASAGLKIFESLLEKIKEIIKM